MTISNVLAILVMLVGGAPQESRSPAPDPAKKQSTASGSGGTVSSKPEKTPAWATPAELPFAQLWEIAWSNEARFDVEFVGKRIQVNGQFFRIVNIGPQMPPADRKDKPADPGPNRYLLWFQMSGTRLSEVGVACEFVGPQQLAHLSPSDAVEVVGTINRFQRSDTLGGHVLLKDCTVIRPAKGKQP